METLDSKHMNMLDIFKHNETILIPQYNKCISEASPNDAVQYYKNKIYRLQKLKREYYFDNSKLLFTYYEREMSHIKTTNFFSTDKTPVNDVDNCKVCKCELVVDCELGKLVCSGCFRTKTSISNVYSTHYTEAVAEYNYSYKRINHFKEVVLQFQAKENTLIQPVVFENIKNKIIKERLAVDELNTENIKEILKKLKYKHLYEHVSFIKDKLGIKPPVFTIELEQRLYHMFHQIQTPYSNLCSDDRSNFLIYHFVLGKLLTLCGETKYNSLLSTIKNDKKLREHEHIWGLICKKLGW